MLSAEAERYALLVRKSTSWMIVSVLASDECGAPALSRTCRLPADGAGSSHERMSENTCATNPGILSPSSKTRPAASMAPSAVPGHGAPMNASSMKGLQWPKAATAMPVAVASSAGMPSNPMASAILDIAEDIGANVMKSSGSCMLWVASRSHACMNPLVLMALASPLTIIIAVRLSAAGAWPWLSYPNACSRDDPNVAFTVLQRSPGSGHGLALMRVAAS